MGRPRTDERGGFARVSPELLRQYPFFGLLSDTQLKEIAMSAVEVSVDGQVQIFGSGDRAEALYFLLDGSVELYNYTETSDLGENGILVGTINPGEPFSISAVIEPHLLTS